MADKLENLEIKVKVIIRENVDFELDTGKIGFEDDLMDYGINSGNYMKIIVGIEEEFGFEFNDRDLNFKNFNTLKAITEYIQQRRVK